MKHISAITNTATNENKRFAWLPVKLDSEKILWLTHYYEIVTFVPITDYYELLNCEKLSVDEYIVRKLSR